MYWLQWKHSYYCLAQERVVDVNASCRSQHLQHVNQLIILSKCWIRSRAGGAEYQYVCQWHADLSRTSPHECVGGACCYLICRLCLNSTAYSTIALLLLLCPGATPPMSAADPCLRSGCAACTTQSTGGLINPRSTVISWERAGRLWTVTSTTLAT